MNIKEIKSNYEKATQIVLKSMVQDNVEVKTVYNLDQDVLVALLTMEQKGQNEEPVMVVYNVMYKNEDKIVSIAAMARHFIMDNIGLSTVMYEAVPVDETFMTNIKAGIQAALAQPEEIIKAEEERLEKESKEKEKEEGEDQNPTENSEVEVEVVPDSEESVAN